MYITSLEINNFKNLRHLKLDNIPKLVVIAGPNGSGKSSVFDALRIFKEAIAGYSLRNPGISQVHSILNQVGPVITVGESEAIITTSIKVSETERKQLQLPQDHTGVLAASIVLTKNPVLGMVENIIPQRSADIMYLQQLFGKYHADSGLGAIDHIGPDRQFSNTQVTNINFSNDYIEAELQSLVVNSTSKFANLAQTLVTMHLLDIMEKENQVQEPHRYINGVREIFRHFLPDKEFLRIDIATDFSYSPRILVRGGSVEHDINQLSSGQREILMTYTHLEKFRPTGSIILFDEPELHLHSSLQTRVISHLQHVLEKGNNQIWVITHSEEIVNTTEFESLFSMTGKGDPATVAVKDRTDRINLLQHLGANIGLQLTSPRILFLEGVSDAELLPLFFDTIPTGVSLVDTTGKDTLMRLTSATMKLLEEVVTSGQFYLVRDLDVEDDPDNLNALAKKYAGHFFTWDRYHIENYLLDEVAIYQVLFEDPDIRIECSSSSIQLELRQLANAQKENVLAKHLEARLNASLKKRLRLNASEGVKNSLLKAAKKRKQQLNELLDSDYIEQLYAEVQTNLDKRWEVEWKELCIGRDVLQAYHKKNVKDFYGYEVFRNKVARKIRDLKRVPNIINDVMNSVTLGLNLDENKDIYSPASPTSILL